MLIVTRGVAANCNGQRVLAGEAVNESLDNKRLRRDERRACGYDCLATTGSSERQINYSGSNNKRYHLFSSAARVVYDVIGKESLN